MDESADGLIWENRRTLFRTPGRMEIYPTMIGLDGDANTLGPSFYLYYQASDTMNRNSDDELARRTLTIRPRGAASLP